MTDLSTIRDLTEALLQDSTNLVFSTDQVDNAIHLALMDYSAAIPYICKSDITLTAASNEIPITSLPSLQRVYSAWWPYDPTVDLPDQSPNAILNFAVEYSGASAALIINTSANTAPAIGDVIRVHYATLHDIQGLATNPTSGSATTSTLPGTSFYLLAKGAAGYALLANSANRDDILSQADSLASSDQWLQSFYKGLTSLQNYIASDKSAILFWPPMDKYERVS